MNEIVSTEDFIKGLFEKNRALFGDTRMEVDENEEPPAEGAAEGESTDGESTEDEDKSQDDKSELPEWAKKELSDVRAEAANYRTKLREAEAKLSQAKTPEEVAEAISELRAQNEKLERDLLVTKVATKHKLPADLADLLKGADEAELEAHAKVLAKYAPVESSAPGSLSGGLTPDEDSDGENDPRKLAAKIRRY